MSAMFYVKVINSDIKKGIVQLSLTIINSDQKTFPHTKSFALMLLLDPIREYEITSAPILSEISLDDILNFNLDIIRKKENKIIKKVVLSDLKNWPLSPDMETYADVTLKKFWSSKKLLPNAILTITTTHNTFVSHLDKKQAWESGAFSLN